MGAAMETAKLAEIEKDDRTTLTEEEFFKRLRPEEHALTVPELGEGAKVVLRPLSLDDREKAHKMATENGHTSGAKFQGYTLAFGMVRPRVSVARVQELIAGNPRAVDRIAKEIWKLSGLDSPDAVKNA